MEKMEEKELAAAAESSALVSFKHQCSCRYSRATTVCPRPSPRLPRRVLRWRRERERERERKERNIDNGFWGRCPFSAMAMDGSTQCPVTQLYLCTYIGQLCIAAFSVLVFIRTSFGGAKCWRKATSPGQCLEQDIRNDRNADDILMWLSQRSVT